MMAGPSSYRGDPDHSFTRGFLCAKVTKYLDRQYHSQRLLHPLRRTGDKGEGRLERIHWDAALDEIAEQLSRISAEFGSEAILPYSYAGTMGLLNGSGMDRRFFHRLGASRPRPDHLRFGGWSGLGKVAGHSHRHAAAAVFPNPA